MRKTKSQISYNMSQVRGSGSRIERELGVALWAAGFRYRKQYRSIPGKPDFVLVSDKIAIFCDSSFWHGRYWPKAAKAFKTNRDFWIPKIRRNIARDRAVNRELRRLGWVVVRFWDDQILYKTDACVSRIKSLYRERKRARKHDKNRSG